MASTQISILDAQQGNPARNAWAGIVSFDYDKFDTFEGRLTAVLNLVRVSFPYLFLLQHVFPLPKLAVLPLVRER